MNESLNKEVKTLRPFTRFIYTIGELPTSYLMSMTYEEQLIWLCNYLTQTIIPTINNNAEAVKEVQDLVKELQDYINNYFDNLDVQEEINNKLDDMAESGQLTDIIAQYLQLAGVLAFNTLSELVNATNIVEGSICKTLGNTTYNDGYGAFYKIRTITSGDVVDGVNIVALNISNTLIAELIKNSNNGTIQDEINEMKAKKKIVIIGDSFSNSAQSGTPLWYTYLEKWHNVDAVSYASDGVGFLTGTNNFLVQLQNAKNNLNYDEIEAIYIVGGINDVGNSSLTYSDFETNTSSVLDYVKNNFGDKKVYVVGILPFQFYNFYSGNNCFTDYKRSYTFQAILSYLCQSAERNIIFRNGEYLGLLQPDYFGEANQYNQRHPSAVGEKIIANFIENGEQNFGYRNADYGSTYIKSTPLICDNGDLNFQRLDNKQIGLVIYNYDNTRAVNLNLTGLPFMDNFVMVTDEAGHCSAFYTDNGNLVLPANVGLNSGNIFFSINWDLM